MKHKIRLSHEPGVWRVVDHSEFVDAQRDGRILEEADLTEAAQPSPAKGATKPSKEG